MNDSCRDALEGVEHFVDRCDRTGFSGTVVFTLHFRRGGVGRTQVETKQDLDRGRRSEPVSAGPPRRKGSP